MKQITFYQPRSAITARIAVDALALVDVKVPVKTARHWTDLETLIAYDWAIREHMAASDLRVKRRVKPSFVESAEVPR